jgi:hypothetical protein
VSALLEALRAHGGTLADVLVAEAGETAAGAAAAEPPGPAQIAAAGPRAAGSEAEYELLLEMILEGSRLHYGTPRVVRTEDRDLALLLGDQLYALGLSRLAALGDLDAVAELADLISLVAQAHADGDAALADAVWEAGAVAIGWGATDAHERAKRLARAEDRRATDSLRAAATAGRPS